MEAGSPRNAAESGSLTYRLPVPLLLLSTPPRGDAVTVDYARRDSVRRGLTPR